MSGQDYSDYSILELEEALRMVDGRRYPENEAALKRELEARRKSGEYERFLASSREKAERKRLERIGFARRLRPLIAVYLLLSALACAVAVFMGGLSPAEQAPALIVALLFTGGASAAGVGLLLGKAWAHWAAVAVLALLVLQFQLGGIVFNPPSLLGLYVQVGGGLFFSAGFELGFEFALGADVPTFIAINVLAAAMILYLFVARNPALPADS